MKQIAALLFACTILLVGCQTGGREGKGEFPVVLDAVTVRQRPGKIVSLSPVLTDMIYALGNQFQLAGVSDYCRLPDEAEQLPQMGTAKEPDIAAIEAATPDLIVSTVKLPEEVLARFTKVPCVVIAAPTTLQQLKDTYQKLGAVVGGAITGKKNGSNTYQRLEEGIVALKTETSNKSMVLFVAEGQVATGDTLMGELFALAGIQNCAQKGKQYLYSKDKIAEDKPDVIFCAEGLEPLVRADAILGQLESVKSGRIVEFGQELEHRGDKLIEAIKKMKETLK